MRIKELLHQLLASNFGRRRVSSLQVFSIMVRLSFLRLLNFKKEDVIFSCFGFTMHASSYEALEFLLKEIFFEDQYFFFEADQRPFIVDCGSNIGISVLYFKHLYPQAEVLCFEPQQKAFELLTKNIEVNKLQNVNAHNIALSDHDGEIDFFEPDTGVGLMASIHNARETRGKLVSVPTKRLSSFLKHQRKPALIKIDVEGAENLVIEDLTKERIDASQMVIEYHHGIENLRNSLADFLKVLELDRYVYNISASYRQLNSFQDIRIHLNKKS